MSHRDEVKLYRDANGDKLVGTKFYYLSANGELLPHSEKIKHDDEALQMARDYPAYWKTLPGHWNAIDTYRVNRLFPVDDPSGQLLHSRKKLLVPGCRTGGKTVYQDIKEAHRTLGAWLAEHPEHKA